MSYQFNDAVTVRTRSVHWEVYGQETQPILIHKLQILPESVGDGRYWEYYESL